MNILRRFEAALSLLLLTVAAYAQDPLGDFADDVGDAWFAAIPTVLAVIGPIFVFSLVLRFLMRKIRSVAR